MWTEPVYRDLLAVERGKLDVDSFRQRYMHRKAILVLDITGFTETGMELGEIQSFLRILNIHKLCDPVLRSHDATLVRAFADDLVALFDDPNSALNAAFAIHDRVELLKSSRHDLLVAPCCIGVGYGDVFAIGPNLAMGNEMNQASKLGEDTATAGETLLTANAYRGVRERADVHFAPINDVLPFSYVRATASASMI